MRLSVIIPTRDEELHVERAIASARAVGTVFVLDSESTDRTVELATAAGATVCVQPWLGHAAQKNWALDHLDLSSDWVMFLDADEWVSPALAVALQSAMDSTDVSAYYLPRKNIFLGRSLEYAWWYPDWQLRLFRRGTARYEAREVHEHMVVTGQTEYLGEPLWHENLKGIEQFLLRHVRYASAEAEEMSRLQHGDVRSPSLLNALTDASARRKYIKARIWSRLPCRAAVRFCWMYFIRRGYKDGAQGLAYSQLIASYESMIDAFLLEERLRR